MRIPPSSPPPTELHARPAPQPAAAHGAPLATAQEQRLPERRAALPAELKVTMPASRLSFDIDPAGHAVTLTLADRSSGEVYLKLVYDRGGLTQPLPRAGAGQRVDIAA